MMQLELSKEFLERLQTAIEAQDDAFIVSVLADEYPADISELLASLQAHEAKYITDLLGPEIAAQIISNLEPESRKDLLRMYESDELATIVSLMDSDDAVDLLDELAVRTREEIISLIKDPETAAHIVELLRYEETCAGGLMAKELIKARNYWTVVECVEQIRRQAEEVEKVYYVYVVDAQDILLGIVSLKKIILARPETIIAEICQTDIVSVASYMQDYEVAEIMQRYDLEAVPVVNLQNRLLGRIMIDDVIDVITEQAEADQQMMAGLSDAVEEDDTVWRSSRVRLPWLLIGMCGGLMGARFAGLFEEDIRALPAMAFFIPLITATGGNVGIQSSTVAVQSLSGERGLDQNLSERLLKVLLVALLNGIIIAGLSVGFNILFGHTLRLSLTVATALFSVVIIASFMGTLTPLVLEKININPALASGPFITTANDLIGLAIYFGVAHILYGL